MLRKGWEAIALLVVVVVAVQLVVVAIQPFLPILGLVVIGIITGVLVKVFIIKRKFW
jgi:hypothetical protein